MPPVTTLSIPRWAMGAAALVFFAACGSSTRTTTETHPPQPAQIHGTLPPIAQPFPGSDEIAAEIRAILDDQVVDWNAGNIRGYMNGYSRSDSLYFISDGTLRTGWQNNLYAYVRNYPSRASMGTLSFEDLHVQVLSSDTALVFGRYRLIRADDEPLGLFSLIVRKEADGWRIIHDHTSSSP